MEKLNRALLGQVKKAFVDLSQLQPQAQAAPPGMDPNAGGGMPPPGMDPSAGGMPPPGMDPSAGGMPPPGGDPSQGGGSPDPAAVMAMLSQMGAQGGGAPAGGGSGVVADGNTISLPSDVFLRIVEMAIQGKPKSAKPAGGGDSGGGAAQAPAPPPLPSQAGQQPAPQQ